MLRANDRFGRKRRGLVVDGHAPIIEAKGAGAGRALAHARRSPIRNCSARSSRICGAGSPRWVKRRAEAHEPPVVVGFGQRDRVALKDRVRIGRQFAGKDGRFGDAIEGLPPNRLALFGHADDGVERLVARPDLSLAGGADRRQRDDVDLRPDPFRARDRFRRERAQDRLQPVVALMMQMVGLGRREQDAVDAWSEDRSEIGRASGAEGAHDFGQRILEILDRSGAGIECGERVDEDDLPIEPGEMIAKEWPRHVGLIGLVTARHHGRERAGRDRRVIVKRNRREGQRRRAGEIAGHQEPAGRQG